VRAVGGEASEVAEVADEFGLTATDTRVKLTPPPVSLLSTHCYGYAAEYPPSSRYQVPSSRYWKSKFGEDIHIAESVRYYRESGDLPA
jgi:hypothetical protein